MFSRCVKEKWRGSDFVIETDPLAGSISSFSAVPGPAGALNFHETLPVRFLLMAVNEPAISVAGPATVIVSQFLQTFEAYAPSQKSGGLTASQFLDAVHNGGF